MAGSIALPGVLKGGGFTRADSPSQQAQAVMRERLGVGPTHLTIVFASDELDARGRAFRDAQEEALSRLTPEELPGLILVETAATTGSSALIANDARSSLAVLSFNARLEPVQDQIPRIRELVRTPDLRTYVTGEPAVYRDVEEVSARDLRTAESYTVPIAVLVLLLIFGTLVAAGLPVIGGGAAVAVTLGSFYVLAHFLDLSIFAMNSATLLGLAVGIDYSLFMVGRFREELAAGRSRADAVEETVRHAGRAIFFSGLAVLVGLLGLMSIPYMSMRSIGLGGSLVVFFSVLSALTLLPALLGVLGTTRQRAARLLAPRARGPLLAALVDVGHAASLAGARRDRGARPGPRVAGAAARGGRAGRHVPAHLDRVASGLRHPGQRVRPLDALADRGRPDLGGRPGPAVAGQPRTPDGVRRGAGEAGGGRRGHEHREPCRGSRPRRSSPRTGRPCSRSRRPARATPGTSPCGRGCSAPSSARPRCALSSARRAKASPSSASPRRRRRRRRRRAS